MEGGSFKISLILQRLPAIEGFLHYAIILLLPVLDAVLLPFLAVYTLDFAMWSTRVVLQVCIANFNPSIPQRDKLGIWNCGPLPPQIQAIESLFQQLAGLLFILNSWSDRDPHRWTFALVAPSTSQQKLQNFPWHLSLAPFSASLSKDIQFCLHLNELSVV